MGKRATTYIPKENVNFDLLRKDVNATGIRYGFLSKKFNWGDNGISNLLREEHNVAQDRLEQLASYLGRPLDRYIKDDQEQSGTDFQFHSDLDAWLHIYVAISEIKDLLSEIVEELK